ncbi:MAG: TraR/DksA family transcriptional regulator [Phycisphaeraceae bacterium]|nr:TraR/DksA family transcriptional regulator [Phycisphaeraceae bacterium]
MAKKTTGKKKTAARPAVKTAPKPKPKAKPATKVVKKPGKTAVVASKAPKPAPKTKAPSFVKPSVVEIKRVAVKEQAEETQLKEVALTEDELRKVKTGLTKKDLEHYRELLMQKRAEILGDVASLETDARNNGGNLSNMPLHMADIGSDNYEQEFTLGLVESERKLLQEINEALLRIKAGTYGVCVEMGVPIAKARLDAKPWAKHCIEAARLLERTGMR